jgi:UrcA family protein
MEHNMNKFISTKTSLSLSLVFAGLFTVSGFAVAEQADEEIIVRAPEQSVIDVTPVGSSVTLENIVINRSVSTTDLDLSNPADVEKLDARIDASAKESCQKLSDMSPLDRPNAMRLNLCVKRAVAGAGKQRETAITAGH